MPFHPLDYSGPLPTTLNDPFSGVPDAVGHFAASRALRYIRHNVRRYDAWRYETTHGKMFGVLVCEKKSSAGAEASHELGFLIAYSGQIGGREDWSGFVPAVYDYLQPDGHFKQTERHIVELGRTISSADREKRLRDEKKKIESEEKDTGKNTPKEERTEAAVTSERRRLSRELQTWLFDRFIMVNGSGERKNLNDIFRERRHKRPPGGSGECCAPKLLQYAFLNHLLPLSVAEFWMGIMANAEGRENLQFYGACENKCRPILEFMLQRT